MNGVNWKSNWIKYLFWDSKLNWDPCRVAVVKLLPNAHAFLSGRRGGEKRTRKSRGPNKCRRTWFYSISRFFPFQFIKKRFMYTNRWTFHVLLFPQCTVQRLTFCLMHRHRKLITTKETMACNCLPKEKSWDSQLLLILRTAPTCVQTVNHKLG